MSETKVQLTVEEGNFLLASSAVYQLPEKLGENTFSVADRAIAGDELRSLYKSLKSYSPMAQRKERYLVFGPADNFKGVNSAQGQTWETINLKLEVEVRLDDDAVSGAIWCLLSGLHPESKFCERPMNQEDCLWPLVAKFGKTKNLREMIGYAKGAPRRWKNDSEYKDEKKPEEKKG